MTDQLEADTQSERQQLIERGKELGLKQAANMKLETLKQRIAEAEKQNDQLNSLAIEIDDDCRSALIEGGFNFKSLEMRAKEYRIDRLIYDRKKKAFGCFSGNKLVDFLDIGAF